jgi:hypothetical protein
LTGFVEDVEKNVGIDEIPIALMNFVPGHTLGGVDGDTQIAGQTFPIFVGAPVGVGKRAFLFRAGG